MAGVVASAALTVVYVVAKLVIAMVLSAEKCLIRAFN